MDITKQVTIRLTPYEVQLIIKKHLKNEMNLDVETKDIIFEKNGQKEILTRIVCKGIEKPV